MEERIATEEVTFSLPADLMREMQEAVAKGLFPSQQVLVHETLTSALQRSRDENLEREFQEATQDPLFRQDLEETEQAFQSADSETVWLVGR